LHDKLTYTPIYKVKWRHSSLWWHYDLHVMGQHGVLCEVTLWIFVALFEQNWISWFKKDVRIITILRRKWCHNNKRFSELVPHHGGKQQA